MLAEMALLIRTGLLQNVNSAIAENDCARSTVFADGYAPFLPRKIHMCPVCVEHLASASTGVEQEQDGKIYGCGTAALQNGLQSVRFLARQEPLMAGVIRQQVGWLLKTAVDFTISPVVRASEHATQDHHGSVDRSWCITQVLHFLGEFAQIILTDRVQMPMPVLTTAAVANDA
ncbi:hypothetical protein RAZWK3B_11857 [Roseobacter sp. AzwK-3b]|nr:hypothetical protein RAZWK3B_11857 [Roseobacter sp. AzwK-3b]